MSSSEVKERLYQGVHFGGDPEVIKDDGLLNVLMGAIRDERLGGVSPLGGRNKVSVVTSPTGERIVGKRYLRGGLLKWLVRGFYLRNGERRPRVEFNVLRMAASRGITVPEPVAYAYRGDLLYEAWLFTKQVDGDTVVELCQRNDERFRKAMALAAIQAEKLVEARIHHVDLHPGNVLVSNKGEVFLLDFDKAYEFRGKLNELRDHYVRRWRRAVIKHGLPEVLNEIMCLGLRKNFEVADGGA